MTADVVGLEDDFESRLQALVDASGGRIRIVSGYRSVEHQTRLWNDAVKRYGSEQAARRWVAPPGKSNHNRGVAADLAGDLELAHQLAPQFGLLFPMTWEPWHIEPVGARLSSDRDAYTTAPSGHLDPTSAAFGQRPLVTLATLADAIRSPGLEVARGEGLPGFSEGSTDFTATGPGGGSADSFLAAIRKHESGGNYTAKNPHGSASGAYQFIDSTWRAYADRLGISARRAMDASPADQDRVARAYLESLQGISTDPRVWSVGWYAGPGTAQRVARGELGWDYHPGGANPAGLTIGSYADWIAKEMGI